MFVVMLVGSHAWNTLRVVTPSSNSVITRKTSSERALAKTGHLRLRDGLPECAAPTQPGVATPLLANDRVATPLLADEAFSIEPFALSTPAGQTHVTQLTTQVGVSALMLSLLINGPTAALYLYDAGTSLSGVALGVTLIGMYMAWINALTTLPKLPKGPTVKVNAIRSTRRRNSKPENSPISVLPFEEAPPVEKLPKAYRK